jgi:TetR/AcrR family transcriptional repressor of nem operon
VQYDREEILDKAMQAFWEQGYCATSMANLVETTDLKPGSLYAAFESKQGLFLATLDHYGALSAEKLRTHLGGTESPLEAIESYFDRLADNIEKRRGKTSCFLVNTVLELSHRDAQIRRRINRHFSHIETAFVDALTNARENGELDTDTDCTALAAFLMNNIWGLRVLAGTKPAPGRARQVVRLVKQALGASRPVV